MRVQENIEKNQHGVVASYHSANLYKAIEQSSLQCIWFKPSSGFLGVENGELVCSQLTTIVD